MQRVVFMGLLHFIYTVSLPSEYDDPDDDENVEMAKHLLVAADRHAM
jgi:speckle-type POZ protein